MWHAVALVDGLALRDKNGGVSALLTQDGAEGSLLMLRQPGNAIWKAP